jgi:hypothetical protein
MYLKSEVCRALKVAPPNTSETAFLPGQPFFLTIASPSWDTPLAQEAVDVRNAFDSQTSKDIHNSWRRRISAISDQTLPHPIKVTPHAWNSAEIEFR